MRNPFVFLGGTCGKNFWRPAFIEQLTAGGIPEESIFNPVLPEGVKWDKDAQAAEDAAKQNAQFNLFYLGDAKTNVEGAVSIFSMLQLVIDMYRRNRVYGFLDIDKVPGHAQKVLKKLAADLEQRFPGRFVGGLPELIDIAQQSFAADRNFSVFAAGTCGNNNWREGVKHMLQARGVTLDLFIDPQVDDYGDGARYFERYVRQLVTDIMYYIGDPMMEKQSSTDVSAYSGIEALMGLFDDPLHTIVVIDVESFDGYDRDSMEALIKELDGCVIFSDLTSAAKRLVHEYKTASAQN